MQGSVVFTLILAAFVITFIAKTMRIVRQSEELVVERLGKYSRTLNSGFHILIPFIDRISFVADLREQLHTFEPQPVITHDNATVFLNAVTYFRITDSRKAFYAVSSYMDSIEQLIITTLRNLIGELELDQTLTSRNHVNTKLQSTLDEVTGNWGIKITRVEVKEITPAPDIAKAMSSQMVAERHKRAAILEAEGLKNSAILKAEGDKLARILEAEGIKESAVIEANGQAEAAIVKAQAEQTALKSLLGAFSSDKAEDRVLALKYLEMLPKLADGKGVSLVLPDRLSDLGSLATMAGQVLNRQAPTPLPPQRRAPEPIHPPQG